MATTSAVPTLRASEANWVHSAIWDSFWMFSALWGSACLVALASIIGLAGAGPLMFVANIFLAVAHSWSTTFMVIGSPLLAAARKQNRWKFTHVPIIVVVGSLVLGLAVGMNRAFPESTPLTSHNALWALYLGLFWVGHFWHFGNQDFGVLSIYRLKAGQASQRRRRVDKMFTVAMMFVLQPVVYFKAVSRSPFSEAFFSYAPVSPELVAVGAGVAMWLAVILTLAIVIHEWSAPGRSIPKLFYYLVMLSHPIVLYNVHYRLGFFYMIGYFWSHWFIAIGLVGRINVNYYRNRGLGRLRALSKHVFSLGGIVAAALLLHFSFGQYNSFAGKHYKSILSQVRPEHEILLGLVLGLFLAEQLLHYYCDRSLFRFRDPNVRGAVAPLL